MGKLSGTYLGPFYVWLSKCEICGRARSAGGHAKCSKVRKAQAGQAKEGAKP